MHNLLTKLGMQSPVPTTKHHTLRREGSVSMVGGLVGVTMNLKQQMRDTLDAYDDFNFNDVTVSEIILIHRKSFL